MFRGGGHYSVMVAEKSHKPDDDGVRSFVRCLFVDGYIEVNFRRQRQRRHHGTFYASIYIKSKCNGLRIYVQVVVHTHTHIVY